MPPNGCRFLVGPVHQNRLTRSCMPG
jgi:hypothetical protein